MIEGYCPHCNANVVLKQDYDWCLIILGFICGVIPGVICLLIQLSKPADRCTICGTQVLAQKPVVLVNAANVPPPPQQVVVKAPVRNPKGINNSPSSFSSSNARRSEAQYCPTCGEVFPPEGKFCSRCGTEIQ